MKLCKIENCTRYSHSNGICRTHNRQISKYGEIKQPLPTICTVDGCTEPHLATGFCNRHYQQYRIHKKTFEYNHQKPNIAHFYGEICYIELRTLKGELSGVCLIDREEAPNVLKYKWWSQNGYSVTKINGKRIFLHNLLMKEIGIDHKDRDKMNNLKSNLRRCTVSENQRNRPAIEGTSSYKGVYLHSQCKKYCVQLTHHGKNIYGGIYANERDAALAYNKLAKKYHGEFGVLNKVND